MSVRIQVNDKSKVSISFPSSFNAVKMEAAVSNMFKLEMISSGKVSIGSKVSVISFECLDEAKLTSFMQCMSRAYLEEINLYNINLN